jgi:glycosyltransferase involved in cell wall biosynthesis
MDTPKPALSLVVPLYYSAETIGAVVDALAALEVPGGHEIVLVNDGSTDATAAVCAAAMARARVPVVYVEHARNFGEHNAVLTGYRYARGDYIVNLDDDGQHPPEEALRLFLTARALELDVVFGHYETKQHAAWRNAGSWFTNRVTDWLLDKPAGFYLSSFRCVSRLAAEAAARHKGPCPYIDGLLLQVTQRIGSITVRHEARAAGSSGYSLRRLVRLWISTVVNFSVLPLRLATLLGLVFAGAGFGTLAAVGYLWIAEEGPAFGWGSLMAALLLFSGVQLSVLGIMGEYMGRMFLAVNGRPQAVVREVRKTPGEIV